MSLQEDLKRLNSQQADIIRKFNRPSLVVAGPGTGKTRTVSVLIGDLLHKDIRLKEILALTFSDKAATELRERVLQYYPHSFDECWISTFHSFCARILREQYFRIFIKPDFKLLTGFKEALMMSGICKKQDANAFSEFGKVMHKRGFQQEILTFISLLKSNLVSCEEFAATVQKLENPGKRTRTRLHEIANLYQLYEKERIKTGYLDFRDLISLTIKVMQIPEVAASYRSKFKVILVDEFQDTDPAQYLLLSLLKGEGENVKIAVIGDPKQSIYRFRGADPGMMTFNGPFRKEFKARVFPLQINYRCAREIVETAIRLDWKEKSEMDKSLVACSENQGFVKLFKARDELEEARFLTRKIAALLIYGETRKYRPEEIAILVRNNYQVDLLAENLQALHIPFEIAGDMKFFRSEEVIVLASMLKIAALQGNEREEAMKRAFSSPLFELDPLWVQATLTEAGPQNSMAEILEKISEEKFAELPDASEELKVKAGYFAESIKILDQCASLPLNAVFARLLLSLKGVMVNPSSEPARNALHFRNMIADYCEMFLRQNGREALVNDLISEFDEWLTYYASTLEQDQTFSQTGVKIMTVHQSKGLEFPVVAIPGLCEGQFPVKLRENLLINTGNIELLKNTFNSQNRAVSFFNPYPCNYEDHLEEERRLFFVALTRAKEGVIMSYPLRQGTDIAIPAPYLKEVGLIASHEETETRPLNISEFRTRLASLSVEDLKEIEPQLQTLDRLIDSEISVHGIRPRNFEKPGLDETSLPDNFVFSASSLKNYVDCPRRFFFLNILKIKDPLQAKQSWFQTGNAFHAILEELHRPGSIWENGKQPDDNDLEKLFTDKAVPHLEDLEFFQRYQEIESIKQSLPNYISAIFETNQLPPRQTRGVEEGFEFTFHNHRFRGRFDRLVETESGLLVIDYKTTQNAGLSSEKVFERAFTENEFPQEIQMPLYLLACKQMGAKNACATLLYVRQDLYKRKHRQMHPGFMRSAALNFGCGPEYGYEVDQQSFARFEDQLKIILDEIMQNKIFDCRPSANPDARSCLNFDRSRKPKCEFFSFCQERLEELRQETSTNG
jgi:DNA helicase-2/ATP-dependent DNA helicase PcrA